MSAERMKVLEMLAAGKITAEDADRLLDRLNDSDHRRERSRRHRRRVRFEAWPFDLRDFDLTMDPEKIRQVQEWKTDFQEQMREAVEKLEAELGVRFGEGGAWRGKPKARKEKKKEKTKVDEDGGEEDTHAEE